MLPSMTAHGYDTPDLTKDDLTDEGKQEKKSELLRTVVLIDYSH